MDLDLDYLQPSRKKILGHTPPPEKDLCHNKAKETDGIDLASCVTKQKKAKSQRQVLGH